jgi:hypothetical protein
MLKYNGFVRYDILYDKYSCLVRKREGFLRACTFCDKLHVSRHHIIWDDSSLTFGKSWSRSINLCRRLANTFKFLVLCVRARTDNHRSVNLHLFPTIDLFNHVTADSYLRTGDKRIIKYVLFKTRVGVFYHAAPHVLYLIKHDNECFEYSLKYDYTKEY